MTLYDLLYILDCHTVLTVVNIDTKELNENYGKYQLDDMDEVFGPWFGKTVDYIKVKGPGKLYVEIRE